MVSPYKELGVTGNSGWGRWFAVESNARLQGARAVQVYNDMRADATGAAMYQLLSLLVRKARWHVAPGGSAPDDLAAAAFIESCMSDMATTWADVISNICMMFQYGYVLDWEVLKRRTRAASRYADGLVGWRKFEMVAQQAILDWRYDPQSGDIEGAEVLSTTAAGGSVFVPLEGSLLFRTSTEGDNPEGVSVYRAAVNPFQYRRRFEKIEGIGLQRNANGMPKVSTPEGASPADTEAGKELAAAIYNDQLMGAAIPFGWDLSLLDAGAGAAGVLTALAEAIKRKDLEMARAILAQFMLTGLQVVGAQSLAETLEEPFMLSIEAYLTSIRDVLNRYGVNYLLGFNLRAFPGLTAYPALEFTAPRGLDLAAVAGYLEKLTGIGLFRPDSAARQWARALVPGLPGEVADADDADDAPELAETEADTESAWRGGRVAHFAAVPAQARPARYQAITDASAQALRGTLEAWRDDLAAEVATWDGDMATATLRDKLDDYILAGLLAFRQQSILDISAAFWLAFGQPAGGVAQLAALQRELALADEWLGYAGGEIRRTNPAGQATLFGDIQATLEGELLALLLLMKAGRRDEVFAAVTDTVNRVTNSGARGALYAGHTWHAAWAGAVERLADGGYAGPVWWVNDPTARHCRECPVFGADPPGRKYTSMAALLQATGGTLPGFGTECDGNCRCHLAYAPGGGTPVWI